MALGWIKYTSLYVDLGLCHVTCCDQWDISGGKVSRGLKCAYMVGLVFQAPVIDCKNKLLTAAACSAQDPN